MAIKDWITNYPAGLDADANMPEINNLVDLSRASQINAVRNAIFAIEAAIGLYSDPDTLDTRVTNLETSDSHAIHDNVEGEIHVIDLKVAPIGADELLVEDSADLWNKKRIAISSLVTEGNTLDQAYNQGGAGVGRTITIDSGPVFLDASGSSALHLDGYLILQETGDPTALSDRGMIYAKDTSGISELFYIDDSGTITQITSDGYLDTFNSLKGIGLFEQNSDPTFAPDKGFVYTKDVSGTTGLFYMDDAGTLSRLDGYGGGTAVTQQNVLYVGKHGNDGNDGTSVERAFLTFGAALAAASSGDTVTCLDNGLYTEPMIVPDGVDIFAPSATFTASGTAAGFTLQGNHKIKIGYLNVLKSGSYGGKGIKSIVAGTSFIDVVKVTLGSNCYGFICQHNSSVMYVKCEEIRNDVPYDAVAFRCGQNPTIAGTMYIDVDSILSSGDDSFYAIWADGASGQDGRVFGRIGKIQLSQYGLGIYADTYSWVNLVVGEIEGTSTDVDPWIVRTNAHLFLFIGKLINTDPPTENGEVMVTYAGVGGSPLTTKGDLFGFDTADARLPVGADGMVLTVDSNESTGVKWESPAGRSTPNEEEFATLGTEAPGDPTTFGPLTNVPRGDGTAHTPSGYDILVFRNGIKMKYAEPPSTYMHYYYNSVNNKIDILASGDADEYEVVYGSTP